MRKTLVVCAALVANLGLANADSAVPFDGVRHGRGVAVARDGGIYFGGATEEAAADGGLAKLRPRLTALASDHRVTWTKNWEDLAIVTSVMTDEQGPIMTLLLRGASFDPGCPATGTIERGRGEVAVVLALTTEGSCRWSRTLAGSGITAANAPDGLIAVAPLPADGTRATLTYLDASGGVVREVRLPAGIVPQHMVANEHQLFITGSAGPGWIGALDPRGRLQWTVKVGATNGSVVIPFEIAADRDHVVIGGLFRGSVRFDPRHEIRSHDADDDGFVARYDVRGNLGWAYTYGAASSDQIRGVAMVGSETFAVGNRTGDARLGGEAVLAGDTQVFLLRLDSAGVPREARPLAEAKLGSYAPVYIDTMTRAPDRLLVVGDTHGSASSFGVLLPPETSLMFDVGL
ncbi:hypothetical protein BH11MYX1_BH11MYX1_38070 [soil metagenome]